MDQINQRKQIQSEGFAGRKKRSGIMAAGFSAAIVIAAILAFFFLFGLKKLPAVNMDGQIAYEVVRGEGNKQEGREHAPLLAGDRLIGKAPLNTLDKLEDAVLCFLVRNSVVTVRIGGEVRLQLGSDRWEKKQQIGDLLAEVPIMKEDWGKELEIDCLVTEGQMDPPLNNVRILLMGDRALYPLIGKETKFLLFTALLLIGLMLFVLSMFSRRARSCFPDGLFLALFLLTGSTYVLGSSGFLHLLILNNEILGNLSIFSAYLAPAALFSYLASACMTAKKVRKRIFFIFAVVFYSAFGGATVLSLSQGIHWAVYLPYLYLLIALAAVFALAAELLGGPPAPRNEDRQIRPGVFAAAVFILLNLCRRNLYQFEASDKLLPYFPNVDYIACAVLVLAVFLLLHYYTKVEAAALHEDHAALMSRLAYTDILTGIPNRHHCDRMLERIAKRTGVQMSSVDYTLFIIDVNSLHQVNESVGYEVGDELLRCVAEAVSDAMRGSGADENAGRIPDIEAGNPETRDCFFGRWGGDEFVACTFRSQSDPFETTFNSRIAAINIEKRIPCDVSVSYGSCDLTSGSYDRVREALLTAEKAMKERKKQYYAAHSITGSLR